MPHSNCDGFVVFDTKPTPLQYSSITNSTFDGSVLWSVWYQAYPITVTGGHESDDCTFYFILKYEKMYLNEHNQWIEYIGL